MNIDNEFQWRSELRKLGGDVEPQRDLWPPIATRIAVRPTTRRWRMGLGLVAMLLLTCGVSVIAWRMPPPNLPAVARTAQPPVPGDSAPLAWAVPVNPVLATAARNLDVANAQLRHALDTHPQAVFLVGLLNRTNEQRMRLLRQDISAG
jgi:hypothetical protein